MRQFFVYILLCGDGKYYTGITNDVEKRVWEHNVGMDPHCFTYMRRPVDLKFSTVFENVHDAIDFEKRVKGWSRNKKEALIRGDWDEIMRLARL